MTATAPAIADLPDTEQRRAGETPAAESAARHTRNSRLTSVATERRLQEKRSGKPDPSAHLSPEQIEELGRELDALRQEVMDSRGERDAAYIRKVIKAQRWLEMGSRGVLLFSLFPPAWLVGTAGLSVAKIIENMEIGHNVMHGQWDWMRDPKVHSTAWEWDNASPASQWKHSHNEIHHTFTNVLGRDNDLGYGILRVDEDQKWSLFYLGQPVWNVVNAVIFEYSIAAYDLELGAYVARRGRHTAEEKEVFRANAREVLGKIRRQATKDYLIHPLLSGPSFLNTLAANYVANLVRNLWTHSVIICGHFPEGVETFERNSIDGETRGEWYLRQMLGSANISGGAAMHLMTGNLSHQIEHHLFPDMPSNRYQEIAPRIRDIFEKYELTYVTGSLWHQVSSVYRKVNRLALPNPEPGRTRVGLVKDEVVRTVRRSRARRRRTRDLRSVAGTQRSAEAI
jgi:fatty acid desaturase